MRESNNPIILQVILNCTNSPGTIGNILCPYITSLNKSSSSTFSTWTPKYPLPDSEQKSPWRRQQGRY